MDDVVKIYHAGNEVDAEIVLERLRISGIQGYISEAYSSVHPKIYSGGSLSSSVFGYDLYINVNDAKKAKELLKEWDREAEKDVEILAQEAQNADNISEDVRDFLEERKELAKKEKRKIKEDASATDFMENKASPNHNTVSFRRRVAQVNAILLLVIMIAYVISVICGQ